MIAQNLSTYIQNSWEAWEDPRGEKIADIFSLRDPHVHNRNLVQNDDFEDKIKESLDSPLSEMLTLHLKVFWNLLDKQYEEAMELQCQLGQIFCRVLQTQKEDNWGLKLMETLCIDLKRIASTLEANSKDDMLIRGTEDQGPSPLERAADVMMALFRVCAADSRTQETETKRWGMLFLVNQLFKIYVRIDRLQLCKPLIRAIEAQPIKDKFPLYQLVTYKYYVGRKAMFDSSFKEADECFSYAFKNSTSKENKRKILTYLVPVKLFLGWLPREAALAKYNLSEFYEVANNLRFGNISGFNEALKRNEEIFIKAGVYLILEKLRMLLYRNLIKKVCLLYGNHQIPIHILEHTLRWAGYEDIDIDETHCIIANLIFDNQIRGYISYQHQMIVIAKQNPFPTLSTLELKY